MLANSKYNPRIAAVHKARVNVKSLACEARIIRLEEHRCGPGYRAELSAHRRGRLREEARYSHLALAFLRGRDYRAVENAAGTPVSVKRLFEKIARHWSGVTTCEVVSWLK